VLKVNKTEKVHISNIVATLNRSAHDYVLYEKHKRTIDEIEAELSSWLIVTEDSSSPVAFIKIGNIDWISRTLQYTLVYNSNIAHRELLICATEYLFSTYNCAKMFTEIRYDRSEIIKDHIYIGGNIEVRKRQHLYVDGKYIHVVEVAVFQNEFKNE
jgi:hypothetical protein